MIFDEDKNIFLVKSTYQRFHPWGLPGGSLEYGEHPEEAVIREVWEETGLNIGIERLLLVNSWLPDRVGLIIFVELLEEHLIPVTKSLISIIFHWTTFPMLNPLILNMIKRLHGMVAHELA